jgi:hypothetical protein
MALKKRIEFTERTKGLYDGCATFEEMVQRLEDQALMFREMIADGFVLRDARDDCAFLELHTSDQALIDKYTDQGGIVEPA